jgi:hypothetical protein
MLAGPSTKNMLHVEIFPPPVGASVTSLPARRHLTCATFQRPPLNPNAAARRRPGARDGRQALARQQQWFHLLAHLRGSDPIRPASQLDGLCDRREHREQQHHCKWSLHVSSRLSAESLRGDGNTLSSVSLSRNAPAAISRSCAFLRPWAS